MTTDLTELSPEDGFNEENGLDCCPVCDAVFTPNGGYTGAVYDLDGRRYGHIMKTDPADGPFPCADCWPDVKVAQRSAENQSLVDFAGGRSE